MDDETASRISALEARIAELEAFEFDVANEAFYRGLMRDLRKANSDGIVIPAQERRKPDDVP